LNAETVSKFNDIESFRDEITAKKIQQAYYKENTFVKPFIKAGGSIQLSGQHQPRTAATARRDTSKNRSVADDDTLWSVHDASRDYPTEDRRLHTTQAGAAGRRESLQFANTGGVFAKTGGIMTPTGGLTPNVLATLTAFTPVAAAMSLRAPQTTAAKSTAA
jgi:hypothetical protein